MNRYSIESVVISERGLARVKMMNLSRKPKNNYEDHMNYGRTWKSEASRRDYAYHDSVIVTIF